MRKKQFIICLFFFVFGLILCVSYSLASFYPIILRVEGDVSLFDSLVSKWKKNPESIKLTEGSKVRTGKRTWIDFTLSAELNSFFGVGEDSQISILNGQPFRISLDQGTFWILKEDSKEARVLTCDFLIALKQGGCIVESKNGAASVRVYGDSVRVYSKTATGYSGSFTEIFEGFYYSKNKQERMNFEDYESWTKWYKENDKRKDKLTASTLP